MIAGIYLHKQGQRQIDVQKDELEPREQPNADGKYYMTHIPPFLLLLSFGTI